MGRTADILLVVFLLLVPGSLGAQGTDGSTAFVNAVAGAAYDQETGEGMPVRLQAGIEMGYGPVRLAALADVGLPWEPSLRLGADVEVLDLAAIRVGVVAGVSHRTYDELAQEAGFRFGGRVEVGPRFIFLAASGGFGFLTTTWTAVGEAFTDMNPWARLGVVVRPVDPVRLQLDLASDSPTSLWARTAFELSASWEFSSGVRLAGMFALQYSDFFTLTSYVDGFQARVLCFLPLLGNTP